MKTPLSLKTWPNIDQYDTFITTILQNLKLSNLETQYQETTDGKDTWTISDPKAQPGTKQDILCIIVDGDLDLWIEPLALDPIILWLADQLTHNFTKREEIMCSLQTQSNNYLTWSINERAVGPTIEMAQKRLKEEIENCPYPSLKPAYPFQNSTTTKQ